MKTLTPKQRMEGFTELEGVLGEGGVGGAHLMSFLAGIAHAEEVLASQEQDDEPVAWTNKQEINALTEECTVYMYADPMEGEDNIPLYLHQAPRKFVRLSGEEIRKIRSEWKIDSAFARAIEDALEEKNK